MPSFSASRRRVSMIMSKFGTDVLSSSLRNWYLIPFCLSEGPMDLAIWLDTPLCSIWFSFGSMHVESELAFLQELQPGDSFRTDPLERSLLENAFSYFLLVYLSQSVIIEGNTDLWMESVGSVYLFGHSVLSSKVEGWPVVFHENLDCLNVWPLTLNPCKVFWTDSLCGKRIQVQNNGRLQAYLHLLAFVDWGYGHILK